MTYTTRVQIATAIAPVYGCIVFKLIHQVAQAAGATTPVAPGFFSVICASATWATFLCDDRD